MHRNYSTIITLTENPIAEDSGWLGGLDVGLDWNNIRTNAPSGSTPGLAYAAAFVGGSGADDCLAFRRETYGRVQRVRGIVFLDGAYTPPDSHEIELHLNSIVGPHSITSYEFDIGWNSNIPLDIVKWNGGLGSFTTGLLISRPNPTVPTNGMVIEAFSDGEGNFTMTANGVVCALGVDNSGSALYTAGTVGMGSFVRNGTGADPTKFCWQGFAGFSQDGNFRKPGRYAPFAPGNAR